MTGLEQLVRGEWVLSLSGADGGAIRNGAVLIGPDGAIEEVGEFGELRARAPDARVIGDGHGIVLPGLVNAHTHLTEGLIGGMGETATLWEWFERVVDPVGRCLTREDVALGARLRGAEMLLSGTTCVNDMSCHRNLGSLASLGAVDGLEAVGLRGVVSFGAEDAYEDAPGVDMFLAEHEALCARLATAEHLTFRAGLGTILGATDALLEATVELCDAHRWGVHTHLAEVREEVTAGRGRFGRTTVEQADALGLLNRPVIAGHCIWCSRSEVSLLAAHEVAVAHNPVANMILASGVCPVGLLRAAGITVALGTDGAASNDNQDMLGAMKAAALLQKVSALRADEITARDVVQMATIYGARALGLDAEIGSLAPGKRGDVLLLDGNTPELAAIHDPWQQVVYCATPRCVAGVWVDGVPRVEGGHLVAVDLPVLAAEARQAASALVTRAGLSGESVLALPAAVSGSAA